MSPEIEYRLHQLKDAVGKKAPYLSFEFFPPKTNASEVSLKKTIHAFEALSPHFVSVTYGAGGSTKEKTRALVTYIKDNTNIPPAAHLTCVNSPKSEVNDIAQDYLEAGISRIVALRGDPPDMKGSYIPHPEGYAYAHELVGALKSIGDFDISVAAFPEVHPEAESPEKDLAYLKEKMDAGADRAITQYCFDTDTILRFIEKARKAGIEKPIVPGIVAIGNFQQVMSFSKRCGSHVPQWLIDLFDGTEDHPQLHHRLAVMVALEQCRLLLQEGIDEFHFYTLNQLDVTRDVCHALGVREK